MKQFTGKVAVVTGAASGIGRELAVACARRGMKLVLADVDVDGLSATKDLMPGDVAVRTTHCDVSSFEAVQSLADLAFGEFGSVHLLFNNAGVAVLGPVWSATPEDWKWVLGVNLLGVAHGIRSFVPRMIAAGEDGHIVNTSSAAGLGSVAGSGVYCASKHAVVALSECLLKDLAAAGSRLKVNVLCPALVKTAIADSDRHRPAHLAATNPDTAAFDRRVRAGMEAANVSAADIASITMQAIYDDEFYILPHPEIRLRLEERLHAIIGDDQHHEPDDLMMKTERT
ncbi:MULTISPECIES: SDR family NAD(P)-dependent oxidoreductase [Rhodopseudomonas]|uniref:SDR family NAD(P)-dependent oxidoreductase n=1 Tax=Rhodopseudomonas TaxID=1073 RepID=UPI0005C9458E|nr:MULTISPECIES: SDR family NAD(P)-dependent oxidoreductase [Rhodopseudomonas]MDF3809013.1 SDR family NAD(P)-dependent oxidoreductase [Rhodopseudomonas sp. BAL398]WOK16910.1 SDR family NAD(P)-dependent oxidoreductase [Rhodopseudomonas sp. BAL398]